MERAQTGVRALRGSDRGIDSMQDDWILSSRVAPFGNPRINGYLLLPEAYRSLSRPSSALSAKAFPLRSL